MACRGARKHRLYGKQCHPIKDNTGKVTTFNLNLANNEQVFIDKLFSLL